MMLFDTRKRLNLFHGSQLKLLVNGSPINTTTSYKYPGVHLDPTLNFDTHFHKVYKKAAGRVNLLRRIRSSIDVFSAQRIYRTMIMPVLTYCGHNSLGWAESRKRVIRCIENRSLKIISRNPVHETLIFGFYQLTTFKKRERDLLFLIAFGELCVLCLKITSND